jgi:glutaredoxin
VATFDLPQLFQAEWCPYSHMVRNRLTELGVDVVLRQVAAERARRDAMAEVTGGPRGIPTLVAGDEVISGHDEIIAWLDERHSERDDVDVHRAKRRAAWPAWQHIHGPGGPLA